MHRHAMQATENLDPMIQDALHSLPLVLIRLLLLYDPHFKRSSWVHLVIRS